MRRSQHKKLCKRLNELAQMKTSWDDLLIKLREAKAASPSAWRLVQVEVDPQGVLPSPCAGKSGVKQFGAKAVTCFAATSATKIRRAGGGTPHDAHPN